MTKCISAGRRAACERGFTLLELLTVIGLIAVLSLLSLKAFQTYVSNAAYASVESTLNSAMVAAEASQSDPNNLPPALGWYFQDTQGNITDSGAAQYLLGLKLPAKTMLSAFFDPECSGMGCLQDFVQVQHCRADQYAFWARWGDGFSTVVRNLPGHPPC